MSVRCSARVEQRMARRACLLLFGILSAGIAAAQAPFDASILASQVALDPAGFSPGVLDGKLARKTKLAIAAFQEYHKLPTSGEFDTKTLEAIAAPPGKSTAEYTVT